MANFIAAQLLKFTPLEALFIRYNDVHGTDLNPRFVKIDEVYPSTGQSLMIKLSAIEHPPNKEKKRVLGSGIITVNRVNLAEFFEDSITVPYQDNITSRDVARLITQRTGIVFDKDEFVEHLITPQSNTLQTSPSSLRWYGSVPVVKPI